MLVCSGTTEVKRAIILFVFLCHEQGRVSIIASGDMPHWRPQRIRQQRCYRITFQLLKDTAQQGRERAWKAAAGNSAILSTSAHSEPYYS